jgi:hypothetical protein
LTQNMTQSAQSISEDFKKPQINTDERRFVNLNIQRFSEFYPANGLMKSPQSTQSFAIPANKHEIAQPSRRGTWMTQIARIFTDQHASASSALSVFYCIPSAFICVHLRLIFVSLSDRIKEIQLKLFPIINENAFVYSGRIRAHPRRLSRQSIACTRMPVRWHTWTCTPHNPCSIGGVQ